MASIAVSALSIAAGMGSGCQAAPPAPRTDMGGPAADAGPARAAGAPPPATAFLFDAGLFAIKPAPHWGDWLQTHPEPIQSFDEVVRNAPSRPTAERRVIVLQPLGTFSRREAALLYTLRGYLAAYFQMEARVASPLPLPVAGTRQVDDNPVQYRTDVILQQVLEPRLPADAVCFLGITMAEHQMPDQVLWLDRRLAGLRG